MTIKNNARLELTVKESQPDYSRQLQWGTGLRRTLLIAGAMCSFLIGAGFATGQEALQYFTAHGWWGIAAIGLVILMFGWVMASVTEWGRHHQNDDSDPFVAICGKHLGTLFRILVPLFIFSVAVTMVAGAGALLHDVFALPAWAGSTIMAVVLATTLMLGFQRLVEILGRVGPIIIGFIALVSIWVFVSEFNALGSAADLLRDYQPAKAMDSLLASTVLYCTSVMLMAVPYLSSLGKTVGGHASMAKGGVLAAGGFGVVMALSSVALLATLPAVYDKGAPLVMLGSQILPILGYAFFVVTLLGIFTTAAPMLWTITDQLPTPNRPTYWALTFSLSLVTLIGALVFPFDQLVGAIYPFIGVFGIVFFGILAVQQLRHRFTRRDAAEW